MTVSLSEVSKFGWIAGTTNHNSTPEALKYVYSIFDGTIKYKNKLGKFRCDSIKDICHIVTGLRKKIVEGACGMHKKRRP